MKPRSRIRRRIHLGLGGWMYLAVTAFIALAAINSQTNLLFWTFGLMVGAWLVSALISGAILRRLEIKRLLPDHGAVDEPLLIRYELANPKWLVPAFGLVISELDGEASGRLRGKPFGWVMHVGPRDRVQASTTAWPTRRGAVAFQRVRVATTFPFGVLRKSITVTQPGRVLIYPKLYRLRRELLNDVRSRDVAGSRTSSQGGGFEEFYGLREYRPGDPIKMIDWKHSVRTGRMVSRDLTRLTPPKLMVLLDLRHRGDPPYNNAETAISFAASILCEAHLDGFEVGLAVAGVAAPVFPPGHGRWHRTQMLHALGDIDLASPVGEPFVRTMARDVNWLVVHTDRIDTSLGPANAAHLTAADLELWRLRQSAPEQTRDDPPTPPDAPAPADDPDNHAVA